MKDSYTRKTIGLGDESHDASNLSLSGIADGDWTAANSGWVDIASDQGSVRQPRKQTLLILHGIIYSMSRKGEGGDNAVMERFFMSLKMERVWQREYPNRVGPLMKRRNTLWDSITAHDSTPFWEM
ncbi:hypothetical protein [Candidatus Nitrotoga sp. M5]|uniref:hypothetical protein n=1 Tax=Candidatus Nitrotoga sp. M5 TaxID=2890409 RepID=UPI001EF536F1|nr:hypothetical protein [Candidatus Nitrotoga sp. M5]